MLFLNVSKNVFISLDKYVYDIRSQDSNTMKLFVVVNSLAVDVLISMTFLDEYKLAILEKEQRVSVYAFLPVCLVDWANIPPHSM